MMGVWGPHTKLERTGGLLIFPQPLQGLVLLPSYNLTIILMDDQRSLSPDTYEDSSFCFCDDSWYLVMSGEGLAHFPEREKKR